VAVSVITGVINHIAGVRSIGCVICITQFAECDSAASGSSWLIPEVQALLAHPCYARFMATIVIRNLDETVKRRLQVRAALDGRSMEAEARAALTLVAEKLPDAAKISPLDRGLGTAIHELLAPAGGVELSIPPGRKSHRKVAKN